MEARRDVVRDLSGRYQTGNQGDEPAESWRQISQAWFSLLVFRLGPLRPWSRSASPRPVSTVRRPLVRVDLSTGQKNRADVRRRSGAPHIFSDSSCASCPTRKVSASSGRDAWCRISGICNVTAPPVTLAMFAIRGADGIEMTAAVPEWRPRVFRNDVCGGPSPTKPVQSRVIF